MSVMLRKNEHSDVMQFRYFHLLTQEMAVKIDQGFLIAIIGLFASSVPDTDPVSLFLLVPYLSKYMIADLVCFVACFKTKMADSLVNSASVVVKTKMADHKGPADRVSAAKIFPHSAFS
jgi:hypothetical protein